MTRKPHPVWDNRDLLLRATENAGSIKEVLTNLGASHNSGNYQTVKGRCQKYGIDLPIQKRSDRTQYAIQKRKLTPAEMFSNRGIKVNGVVLKKYMLIEFDIADVCSVCGQEPVWNNLPLVLEVDHIDGDSFNNEIQNLRIICGHCHSQTVNFRGRNNKKAKYNYCECGSKISKYAHKCRMCSIEAVREKNERESWWPSIETLSAMYREAKTMEALGRELGVSSNSIRKHLKKRGITIEQFKNGTLAQLEERLFETQEAAGS